MTLLSRAFNALIKSQETTRLPLTYGGGFLNQLASTQQSTLGQLGAMTSSGWLFACIDRIAATVAATKWQLFSIAPNGERKEILNHPLLDLWQSVNPFYTSEELLEVSQQYIELTGESWWVLLRNGSGRPVEIWPIRPDRIRPVPSPQKYIAGYLYTIATESIPLALEDVIFIRRPHPSSPYRGLGVVEAIWPDIETEKNAAHWVAAFYKNSAEPGGVIEYDETLQDADFERIVARWKAQHQGVSNAHRVAIIERGHWKDRLYTQRDMQFAELRKVNRDVIIGAFGIPLSVLGITEDVNRANAEAGEVSFARWVLLPRLRRIRGAINERLCSQFGPNLEFDFIDPTPGNREVELNEAERGYRAGFLTKNEARRRVGEDDVEGGEEFGATPLGLPLSGIRMLKSADPGATDLYATPLQRAEKRMERAWASRFGQELEDLVGYLGQFKSIRAIQKIELSDLDGYSWDWWTKYGDEVVKELASAFSAALTFDLPDAGPAEVQRYASQFAETRGARLLKLDGPENLVKLTRERVNVLVADTLANGESLGTLVKNLRSDVAFSRTRARVVARTETATALGQGAKEAAIIQGRDEKHWVTQGDDLVTPECQANEAAGWIPIADSFPSGVDTIPQHPNCRCNTRYRTKEMPAFPDEVGKDIKSSSGHAESISWSKETGKEKGYAINRDEKGNYTLGKATEGDVGAIVGGTEGNAGFYHTHPNNHGQPIVDGFSRSDYNRLITGKSEIIVAQNIDINDKAWIAVKSPGTPTLNRKEFVSWQSKGNGIVGKNFDDYALKYQKGILADLDKFGVNLYYGKLGGSMKQIKTLEDYKSGVLKK